MTQLDAPVPDDGELPELRVTHPEDGICVLTVNCELDMVTTPALGQLLTQELDGGHQVLVVDFSGCDFLGSSGLAVLVAAREHATRTATRLALAGLNRTVARSLQATALDSMFDIHPSVEDALTDLPTT